MTYKINLNNDELIHYGVAGRSGRKPGYGHKIVYALKQRKKKKKLQQYDKNSQRQNKNRKVSDMSTKELIERTNRMRAERDYYVTQKQLENSRPQRKSKGKAFVKKVGRDVIAPAAVNVGRQYLESMLRNQLGLQAPKKKKH